MEQRQKQGRQHQIVKGCTSFVIDVKIKKQYKRTKHSAKYYKKKWKQTAANYARLLNKKIALEKALQNTIGLQVQKKVTRYHVLTGTEVTITSIPILLWKKMMSNWETYIPKRRKSHYEEYKKTWSSQRFFRSFPGVRQDKIISSNLTMRIVVSPKAPARAIYNIRTATMVLTFWYEPYPFPMGWYPTYRGCNKPVQLSKTKSYWMEMK
jgi:hypothetical protein